MHMFMIGVGRRYSTAAKVVDGLDAQAYDLGEGRGVMCLPSRAAALMLMLEIREGGAG
jgi:hypothetical protein